MADSPTPAPASGPVGRARASLRALEVLHELEQAGGEPTDDQFQALRAWAGWGPMAPALEPERDRAGAWAEIGARLEKLLSPERYAEARAATYNAFYTPEDVSGACWDLLKGMGFARGRVLEPGCGAGAFIGTTPEGVDAEWVGVERDPTTASIARFLHPEATIIARPLQEANLREGAVDAVIGNVPFGRVKIFDPLAPEAVKTSLHDYAIWSSVRALAPGGIAVLVTSTGTLDKTNADARKAIDKEAVLLGAIRLPNGAFSEAGTNVATDILVLRRRKGNEPAPRKKNDPVATNALERAVQEKTWLSTSRIHYLPEGDINQWYARFTDGVLGKLTHDPVPGRSPVTVAADQDRPWQEALAAEVAAITDRVQANDLGWDVLQAPRPLTDQIPQREDGLREGQLLTVEREVPRRNGGVEVKPVLAQIGLGEVEELRTEGGNLRPATDETYALLELRDAALALFEADADLSLTDEQVQPARDRARTLHQAYVAEYGLINRVDIEYKTDPKTGEETEKRSYPKLGGMRMDVDFPSLAALENYDRDTNTAVPADILHRRVNVLPEGAGHADNPHEAVAMSLNQANRVDVDIIAYLLKLPREQVEPTLIEARAAFRDPNAPAGPLVPAGQYLSGSLGRRLERARQAAEKDDAYQVNVDALEEVLPNPLPPEKIHAILGAAWIHPSDVQAFATELLGGKVEVDKYRSTGEWVVEASNEVKGYTEKKVYYRGTVANLDEWGTSHFRGDELLDKALNNRTPTVWKTERTPDGERRVVDKKATRAASVAMERIHQRFASWVWEEPARADRLAAAYNRDFVATRRPVHDGSSLTFPGLSAALTPYETQKNFVAMALSRQGTICAHEMGGGKTLTMFLTAIKHVQLGLVTNPIIVVPNHLLQDITRDGKLAFPSARILMATDEDLAGPRARKRFAAKCAANSWDAIVMTESMFSRIPVHPRTEADFHAVQKAEKATTLQVDAERIGRRVKSVAQKVDSHASQVKALLSTTPKDDGFCHELLNSTMLLLDEASDWMRNLGMMAQADGFNMSSPARTMNGFLKTQWTLGRGGKVLPFTGTPLVDKALELYVQLLMVNKKGLEERGVFSAEDWVRTFVKFEYVPEPTIDGGVKLVKRPAELLNKTQLQEMYDECADVQRGIVDRPELVQAVHKLDATPVQAAHAQDLGEREKTLRGWNTKPGDDTYFSLMSAGRKAALDPHLAGLPEDGRTKLDEMADQIALRYHDNKHVRFPGDPPEVAGTLQLAFINYGVPVPAKRGQKADDRTYGRLRDKLIARGVPANTIRFVHEAKKADQRSALFAKARAGEINVLIGSFRKMGYGTNVQDRLSDIHIADPTWNAADMQQGIKRGHRPGNKHTSMTAHFYPVTGTVDARMYAMNFQKISVEEQFFTRDGAQRMSAKFGEITASDFGSLAAAASDNEVLQKLEQVRTKLEVLEMEASGFGAQQTRVAARVEGRLEEIGQVRSDLKRWTTLAEASGRASDDLVRLCAGRHVIDDKTMETTLGGAAKDINGTSRSRNDLVDYKNLRVSIVALHADKKWSVAAQVGITPEAAETLTAATRHYIPLSEKWFKPSQYWRIADAVTSFIDHLPDHIQEAQERIEALEQENERAHRLAVQRFPRQDELNALRSEHDELLHAMMEENLKARTVKPYAGTTGDLLEGTHQAQVWRRPPVGWREVDGTHRPPLTRALHGLHWTLTDAEAPFVASDRFLAEIIGRSDGLVEARLHLLPEVGTLPGTERVAVHSLHSSFGQALKELRNYMVEHLDDEGHQARMWNSDIARLDDANPHSLLREAVQDAGGPQWVLNNALRVPLDELTGTYCLIRTADGTAAASKITGVEDDRVLTDVGTFPRQDVLEALCLEPNTRLRYQADEQPFSLQFQPLAAMGAAPGGPVSARPAAVRAALRNLDAEGKKAVLVVDPSRIPYLAAPGVERIRIGAHALVGADDTHAYLHLPPTVPTLHRPKREHARGRAKIPPPLRVPLRVPLMAITEITVGATTWTYQESAHERAAETTAPSQGPVERVLSPEELVDEAFEVLPFQVEAVSEHLETARRAAADEDPPQTLADLGRALLASLQDQGHPERTWVSLADRVATGLGSHGHHVLALQVRRAVAAAAPDASAWRERTSAHAHAWAAAHPTARAAQVEALLADLPHRKTTPRRQLDKRFDEVADHLSDLLAGEHYADAARLLQGAGEALAVHTSDGRWRQIRTHFDTVVTAAALGRTAAEGASTRPVGLTIPDGLGMLWGRSAVLLLADGDLRTVRIASVTPDHRLLTTDGQTLTTDQIRQIRTTDNHYIALADGAPTDLERALAEHGERSAQELAAQVAPFREHLTASLNASITLLDEDNNATTGVLDRIADAGLRLTIGEESHLVPFGAVACVRTGDGRSWWTDPARQTYALDQAQARAALDTGDHPTARALLRQAQAYWEHVSAPTPIMRALREELDQLHAAATLPRTPGGARLIQIERTGPQGRVVYVYGAGGTLGQDGQAALEDLLTASPALIPAPELNAFTVDPTWREGTVNGRLDQLREDLAAAGIACEVVGATDPEGQPPADVHEPESETEAPPAELAGLEPEPEPVQLSARPELLTPDFHGANQAIKDALRRGDLATAQRIHEFRIDPREGGIPDRAQQPGYELFAELAGVIREAGSVDDAVLRVIYRARDADLKAGDRAEALRLLALAEEISPENGQHTAELRQIRSNLEASETPAGKEPTQEPGDLSSGAATDPSSEHVQDGLSKDLTAEQQSLLHGAQERGFLMMGTVGAEELASGAAPAAPATHTEPGLPATAEAVRTPAATESSSAAAPAPEEATQEPEPAAAPPVEEPAGLFAIEPQALTAGDVQHALDNVAAIPNPVGVFNVDQTSLIARARRAHAAGDTAAAAAALTHPRMNQGKAARKLQAAVGHLVRSAPVTEGSGDIPQASASAPVSARAAQTETTTSGLPEHLVRAVVYRLEDPKVYVPADAPREWREAITRVGWRFDDDHAPWAHSGPSEGGWRRLREEFAKLADPPTFVEAKAWNGQIREALGAQASDDRERELRGVGQHQAHAEIARLIRDGEVRAAYGVMAEHVTALRRAGLVPDPWVIDPEQGLADPYTAPATASRSNAEHLERQAQDKDTWTAQEVADLAEQVHRQCPHLNAQQAAEILPEPSPEPDAVAGPGMPNTALIEHFHRGLAERVGASMVVFNEENEHLAVGPLEEVSADGVRVRGVLRSFLVPLEDIAGVSTPDGYWWADPERDACQQAIDAAHQAWERRDFAQAQTQVDRAAAYWAAGPMPSPAEHTMLRFSFDRIREHLDIAQALQQQGLTWNFAKVPGIVSEPHLYVIGEGEHAQRLTPAQARTQYLDEPRDQAATPEPDTPSGEEPSMTVDTASSSEDPGPAQSAQDSADDVFAAAGRALEALGSEVSPEHREQVNTALRALLDHDQHADVTRLARDADLVDPQGWWERADLLSRARFARDPEGLASAIRIDYDGARATIVRGTTADDSDQPVRDLLKDKSGPYKARYRGQSQHWELKRRRGSVEDYRDLLADLLDDLSGLGRVWVTENVHAELSEHHRAQAEAALASVDEVAPVNADGHVGELADVLTYPALRVSAVIRHKDSNGEPVDSWTVVYDTGAGAELTERTSNAPDLRRGQILTDVQVKIHDHSFSAQGEPRTFIIRVPSRDKRAFPLTAEQEQIRAAALDGKKTVVQAGAGTGKTATMGVVAESLAEQGRRGVYVVYGRANADEAALKLAHVPIATNTIHAFARRAVGGPYNKRINGDKTPNWKVTADALRLRQVKLPSGTPLDGDDLARLLDRTVQAFELSADLELTTVHIPRLPGLSDRDHDRVQRLLEPLLGRAWADMCDPAGTLFRYRHDTYVKIWQLTPGGPKMRIGGQGRPYLLADEAQDMNPVAEAILQAQTHMQQIWVGDSSQAIHGWRGAKDALVNQAPDVELTLSQSFRFGEAVAAEANRWLGAIDAPLRVKGTPDLDTIVHDRQIEAPDAVLARTNAGAFNAALNQLRRGRRVAIVGGTGDLTDLVRAAEKLRAGQRTTHPDLAHFRSWGGVVKVANDRPEDLGSLAPFVRLVDKLGTEKVRDALAKMTDTDPEVEVCTAHKSKGLEWDRVQIADDFAPKEGQQWSGEEFKAEAQLAYVATTRARKELGRGSLSYIDDYIGTVSAWAAEKDAVLGSGQEEPPAAQEAPTEEAPQSADSAGASPGAEPVPVVSGGGPGQAPADSVWESEQSQEAPQETPSRQPVGVPEQSWVPDIPYEGELEPTSAVERIRALTNSLMPHLANAMDQPENYSGLDIGDRGLIWDRTPSKHMAELQGLELIRRGANIWGEPKWLFTPLGEAVHIMLWRQNHGPDKELPQTAAQPRARAEGEEPAPGLFAADSDPRTAAQDKGHDRGAATASTDSPEENSAQEPTPAPAGEEGEKNTTDASPGPEVKTVPGPDPVEVTPPKPEAEKEQEDRTLHVEPPSTGDSSAPAPVDPKEAFDHGDASASAQRPPSEEELQPTLFDEVVEPAPTPQEPQHTPQQAEEPQEDPQVSEPPELKDPSPPDYADYADQEILTAEEQVALEASGVAAPGAAVPQNPPVRPSQGDSEPRNAEEDATGAQTPPGNPDPAQQAEQPLGVQGQPVSEEEGSRPAAAAAQQDAQQGQAPPQLADTTGPQREDSPSPGEDPTLDTEANRTRASRGEGPLRRGSLVLELPDGSPDDDQDQNRRQATIEVGGPSPSPGSAAPSENDGRAQPTRQFQEAETTARPEPTGAGSVIISGHQLRAADKRWQKLLDTQGREAAREAVDPDVYDTMRQRFRQALSADKDVHLVMPSNDPAMVREFIDLAREYGYEITVKAAIPPNPVRVLGVVEQLHDQLTQGTPERAMNTEEGGKEHQNLRQILTDVHNEHLADRVELYPRAGVTTDTTPVIRDHLIGSPEDPRWSLDTPIEKHINKLEQAHVIEEEDHRLRTRVPEMVEGLLQLQKNGVPVHQRWAHTQVEEGLNYLTRTNAERQPFKNSARRTTMDLSGEAAANSDGPPLQNKEKPPLPEEPHPDEEPPPPVEEQQAEEAYAAAPEREPAMAGAPSREEALAAARTSRSGAGRRPPASPKPEASAPGPKASAASQMRHGPRQ